VKPVSLFRDCIILLRKYNLELYMTATELTERGVWGGKSISVFSVLSVAKSYKKHIRFSIYHTISLFRDCIIPYRSRCSWPVSYQTGILILRRLQNLLAQMLFPCLCGLPALGSTLNESDLDKIRLINIFDSPDLFPN